MRVRCTNFYNRGIEFKESMMKVKLMPLLGAVMTLSAVATPFTVTAQTIPSGQTLLALSQNPFHKRQGTGVPLKLTDSQKQQRRQQKDETRKLVRQAFLGGAQLEKLKALKASRQVSLN
jgi:hypothetical protein